MYKIKIIKYEKPYIQSILKIREEVFIEEQGISKNIEFDGKDDKAIHSLVFFKDIAVATGRMLCDGQIGRIAVLKEYRKKQIGTMIMKTFIKEAKNRNYEKIYLNSQKSVISFYEKLGFTISGKSFFKANIEHITMNKVFTK